MTWKELLKGEMEYAYAVVTKLMELVEETNRKPEDMMLPAENMTTVTSVAEALDLLEKDRIVAREMLDSVTEDELETREAPAPWDPTTVNLGHRLLQMVAHLNSHKDQLFYYLKLQGKPVHTGNLWGMRAAFSIEIIQFLRILFI